MMVPVTGFEPARAFAHKLLKLARLPNSPHRQRWRRWWDSNPHVGEPTHRFSGPGPYAIRAHLLNGGGSEIRTRSANSNDFTDRPDSPTYGVPPSKWWPVEVSSLATSALQADACTISATRPVVGKVGFEPTWPCGHPILSRARIPVPATSPRLRGRNPEGLDSLEGHPSCNDVREQTQKRRSPLGLLEPEGACWRLGRTKSLGAPLRAEPEAQEGIRQGLATNGHGLKVSKAGSGWQGSRSTFFMFLVPTEEFVGLLQGEGRDTALVRLAPPLCPMLFAPRLRNLKVGRAPARNALQLAPLHPFHPAGAGQPSAGKGLGLTVSSTGTPHSTSFSFTPYRKTMV